jgi:hypothetical protein
MKKISQADVEENPFPTIGTEDQRAVVSYLDNLLAKVDAAERLQG